MSILSQSVRETLNKMLRVFWLLVLFISLVESRLIISHNFLETTVIKMSILKAIIIHFFHFTASHQIKRRRSKKIENYTKMGQNWISLPTCSQWKYLCQLSFDGLFGLVSLFFKPSYGRMCFNAFCPPTKEF